MKTKVGRWLPRGWWYGGIWLLVLGVGTWQGWSWWRWASAPVVAARMGDRPTEILRIEIPEGTPIQHIGQILEAAHLIRSSRAWDLLARGQALRAKIRGESMSHFQAGTYELSPSQSLQEIAAQILAGQVVEQQFTIPEGWSIQQMATYFQSQGMFSADAFVAATRVIPVDRYPWLPPDLPHLEGFLYPDTYTLPENAVTPEAIVQLMLDRFEQAALPLYQGTKTPLSFLEWVTLSSIVEKEAVVPDERALIAGVFTNRLRDGMTLGADPTVEYGLGIRQTPDQPLTLADVNTPSPYNTYLNPGLPPTPIASPSLASLKAALEPQTTDYLYFVARYDGRHVFSKTLAEHEAAQAQIRDEQAARP